VLFSRQCCSTKQPALPMEHRRKSRVLMFDAAPVCNQPCGAQPLEGGQRQTYRQELAQREEVGGGEGGRKLQVRAISKPEGNHHL
jgi:hypothetical protein